MKDYHVAVCVPSTGEWVDDFGKSLALMFSYFAQNRVKGARSQRMSLLTAKGSMLVYLRHLLTVNALRSKATHILYLDSDMAFPKDLANKMLERDKPVLALNCTTRVRPVQPTAFDMQEQRIDSRKRHGVEEIAHAGMAVMMVEATQLRNVRPPLFMMEWMPEENAYCGEDVYFCMRLQEAGVKIFTDHELSLTIKHVGRHSYSHDDLE